MWRKVKEKKPWEAEEIVDKILSKITD